MWADLLGLLIYGPFSGPSFPILIAMKSLEESAWAFKIYRTHRKGLIVKSRFFSFHLEPSCFANYSFFSYSPLPTNTSETVLILENFLNEVKAAAILEFSTNQTSLNFSYVVHEWMEGGGDPNPGEKMAVGTKDLTQIQTQKSVVLCLKASAVHSKCNVKHMCNFQ